MSSSETYSENEPKRFNRWLYEPEIKNISTSYPINTEEYEIELTIKGYYRCFCDYDINKLPSCDTMYELYGTCYNKATWNKIYNELYKKFS